MNRTRPATTALLSLLLSAIPSFAAAQEPGGETILRHVQSLLDSVKDYTVTLDVSVDMERLKVPRMHATMYFKRPDKIHFESEGFAMIPREGVAFSLGDLVSRFSVDAVARDTIDGQWEYRLTLSPKSREEKLRSVVLDVHPDRWTADRLISELPGGGMLTATFQYEKIEGYWLPSKLVAKFSAAGGDTAEENAVSEQPAPMRGQRPPRNGTVVVTYSDYRVNTGLSDEIFERKRPLPSENRE